MLDGRVAGPVSRRSTGCPKSNCKIWRGDVHGEKDSDPTDNGTQAGLNPALISRGDVAVETLVNAIHKSPVWKEGHNAIILVWDENDYSSAPETNQVPLIVDTNYAVDGVQSNVRYNHFSLLKTVEAGFKLPCLNHACDSSVAVMADLFQKGKADGDQDGDDQQFHLTSGWLEPPAAEDNMHQPQPPF